ncbi:MAG: CHASE3 domain-containing protein [Candidatus Korobacteraceae bacterium]
MQPFHKRFSVIAGFSVLLILLALNGFVIRRQLRVQVQNQVWVVHTNEVLLEISQTESLLKDAETGQRGYLYTGEPRYLAPYDLAVAQIETHIQRLAKLTSDNPSQQARIPLLRSLARRKLKELSDTIALYRTGDPDAARALVLSNRGLFTMDKIRTLIDEMQAEEATLNEVRTALYRHSVRLTVACIYLASLLAAAGLILLAYFILREMNLRERHAAQIRQREEWFRVTLTSIGDGVIATDERGNVIFVNPVAERLTGTRLTQANGRPVHEVFPIFNEITHQPVDNPVKKVMELGRIVGLANHTVLKHRDGTLIPIEDSAAPIRDDREKLVGVVLVFRDATYERQSQEVLRKSEKLAAAARLAATVAHEINNPLEAVGNLIYLAKTRPDVPDAVADHLTLAEQELERVSHITRQTLGFYREAKASDTIDVPALLDSVLRLYSNKLRSKNINVVVRAEDCSPLQGWPGELQQLMSNLISNAADAMSTNGTLRVRISCIDSPDGKSVELTVEDDGPGIAPEYLGRIFEPFFTTKKDVGTGLGLWVCRKIAERHGGAIQVRSQCGSASHGTIFTVTLPCSADWRSEAAKAV